MATPTLLQVSADQNSKNNNVFQVAFDKAWKQPRNGGSPAPSDDVINSSYALQLRNNAQAPEQQHPGGGKNPTSVARRNARERRRIRNVNSAFDELRQHVPNGERNRKKISKVDTLQSAIEYIKALEDLVRSRRNKQGTNAIEEDKENVPTSPKINPKTPTQNDLEQTNDEVVFIKETQQAPEGQKQAAKKATPPSVAAKKQPRPLELTESMLKAFDVMIQKCASDRKKSSEAGSKCEQEQVSCITPTQSAGGDHQLFQAPSEETNSSQIGCDSGFSEFFSKDEDFPEEQLNNLNINNIDLNNNNVPRPRQSSVDSSSALDPHSMDFSASPIFCGSEFGDQNQQQHPPHQQQGAFLSQLENFVPTLEEAASDPSFTSSIMNPVSSSWQQQHPHNPHQQIPASFSGGEMETGGYLASPCDSNIQQSPDGSFPSSSSSSSVSTDLDSINPMFNFLCDPEERFFQEPAPYDGCYDYSRIHGDHTPSFVQSLYIS